MGRLQCHRYNSRLGSRVLATISCTVSLTSIFSIHVPSSQSLCRAMCLLWQNVLLHHTYVHASRAWPYKGKNGSSAAKQHRLAYFSQRYCCRLRCIELQARRWMEGLSGKCGIGDVTSVPWMQQGLLQEDFGRISVHVRTSRVWNYELLRIPRLPSRCCLVSKATCMDSRPTLDVKSLRI